MQEHVAEVPSVTGLLEIHRHRSFLYFVVLHSGAWRMPGGFELRDMLGMAAVTYRGNTGWQIHGKRKAGSARALSRQERRAGNICWSSPGSNFSDWLEANQINPLSEKNHERRGNQQFSFWSAAVCEAPAAAPNERGNPLVLQRCCGWSRRHSRAPGQNENC